MAIKEIMGIFLFLLVLVPTSVFGIADLENKTIVAESKNSDIVLTLEYGENQPTRLEKPIPSLQSGLLALGDSIMEITGSRTKIMGNSFVVHSEKILIYAKGLEDGGFLINSYLIGGSKFEPIKLVSDPQEKNNGKIENTSIPAEIVVLVRQDTRTFWNDTYDLEVKVFDKKINPNPQFHQSLGAIDQADIRIVMKNTQGEELTQFFGKTNSKGYWNGSYFVNQNIVSGGTYIVELNVDHLTSNNFQKFETFIVADSRSSYSSD